MQNRWFNVSIHISFLLTVKLGMKGATGYDRVQPLQREDWIIGIAIRLQSYFARDEWLFQDLIAGRKSRLSLVKDKLKTISLVLVELAVGAYEWSTITDGLGDD